MESACSAPPQGTCRLKVPWPRLGSFLLPASDFHSPVAPELGRSTAGLGSPGAQAPEPPSCSSSVLALS